MSLCRASANARYSTGWPSVLTWVMTGAMIPAGSFDWDAETLARTSLTAAAGSVPARKLTWMVLKPSWLVEVIVSMPDAAPIAASSCAVTWRSTSSGSAPGKAVTTVMLGRTSRGN